MWLLAGRTANDRKLYLDELSSCTTDFGVEFGLSSVQPVGSTEVFPWMETGDDDARDAEQGPGLPGGMRLSLQRTIAAPGLLHILHNAASDLLVSCPLLNEAVDGLAVATGLLSAEFTQSRIIEACFSGPVTSHYKWDIKKVHTRVYRERWGSVAFCCDQVLNVKTPLTAGWDLNRYKALGKEVSAEVLAFDASIMSGDWWAKVFVLDRLYEVIRMCIWWAETCPCHGDLLKAAADHGEPLDPAASKEMQTCPLRGLRLCELAAGDLFKYFEDLCHTAILQVMHGLPQGLQPALRADLVSEFEAGRSYLVFQMSLKLSSYMAPPCLLFACAHHDRTVQHRALRQCLHA